MRSMVGRRSLPLKLALKAGAFRITIGSAIMAKDTAGRQESAAARETDRSNSHNRTKDPDRWVQDALEDDEVREALKLAHRPKNG